MRNTRSAMVIARDINRFMLRDYVNHYVIHYVMFYCTALRFHSLYESSMESYK